MRYVMIGLTTLVLAATADVRPSAAQEYPWCAHYSRDRGSNCGFVSFAQCQATISGIGGLCVRNPRFAYGRAARPYREAPPRRHHRW